MTQYYPCKILKRHFKYCTLIILNNRCGIVKCPHRASCAVFSVKIYIQQGLVICCCLVAKSCLTLCNPLDHSPPGSSVQGILQARILEWEAISYSRGSSLPRVETASPALVQFSSAQLRYSIAQSCLTVTPWTAACQASLFITNCPSLLKLNSQVSDTIQPSHPLSAPSPPVFNLSQYQGLFKWVSFSHQVARGLQFQLQHQSFQYSGLISFRTDWLDLLAVQGTLKSLLQHHRSETSVLQRSAFFMVQISHPYMTTGKTKALTRWTFVGKVMSLLFNMLSNLIIVFSSFSFKEQASFNFMTAVIIFSDFGAPQNSLLLFPLFPLLFAMKWWYQISWS